MATWQINATGDFTLVSAFFADLDGDTLSEDQIGETKGLISETSQMILQNTTNNGFYVRLRANSLFSFAANVDASTNKLQWNSENGTAITSSATTDSMRISSGPFEMTRIQLKHTGNYGGPFRNDAANTVLESCIIDRASSTFNNYTLICWWPGVTYANNCLFVASHASGTKVGISTDSPSYLRNCAIVRNSTPSACWALHSPFSNFTHVENCAFYNWDVNTTLAGGGYIGENNATDKSTANNLPSTGLQTSLVGSTEWESVTWSGSQDFRVKSSTSVKLKNNASLSNTVTSDIIGTVYNYTIGPWQIPGGSEFRKPVVTTFGFSF